MFRDLGRGLVILAALAGATSAAPAQAAAPSPLARCIARQAEAQDFSGVALLAKGGQLATFARGLTAGPGSAPIAVGTRFNLGSSSKMFTAVAIAQLVEADRVGLDDPVGRYVSGLTPDAAKVTIRQLLSHTSGLGNFFRPENLPRIAAAHRLGDLLPLVVDETPAFTPGSRFQYSNTGFLLLGLVVERASGETYDAYLRQHVFRPAGITATRLDAGPSEGRATGMTARNDEGLAGPRAGGPAAPLRPSDAEAVRGSSAGGMFSTAEDMRRFLTALTAGKLVSPVMLRTLATPASAAPAGAPMQMGLGLGLGSFEGHRWIGHNGGLPGANAETNAFPDDDAVAIVLANRDPPAASRLYKALRPVLFDPAALDACVDLSSPAASRGR